MSKKSTLSIKTDDFYLTVNCFLPSFDARSRVLMVLVDAAIEASIEQCESIQESHLDCGFGVDWRYSAEAVDGYLSKGLFEKWVEAVHTALKQAAANAFYEVDDETD